MVAQWVDVHAHFAPPVTPEESHERLVARRKQNWQLQEPPPNWSMEGTLEYMDRNEISMQLLSNIPKTLDKLRTSNDYGASVVSQHPSRFGLLAALPTDNPAEALEEIERASNELRADGFAVTCCYNGVYLGDPSLEQVWAELNRRHAVVFVHPDALAPATMGRPAPVLDVAFETTRTVVDMVYAGLFRRFPDVKLIIAHCGAALPALSGRLLLLGTQPWVPNPSRLTGEEMRAQLGRLYLDIAATGSAHTLGPALEMTSCDHIVYGTDCGVPCTSEETVQANKKAFLSFPGLSLDQKEAIASNALALFSSAAGRIGSTVASSKVSD